VDKEEERKITQGEGKGEDKGENKEEKERWMTIFEERKKNDEKNIGKNCSTRFGFELLLGLASPTSTNCSSCP